MDNLENLVFSGGGVRGVSFCGSIMALHSLNQRRCSEAFPGHIPWVKRTAGASIGALFACAVALRISGERLFRLLDTEAILEGLVPSVNFQMLQQEFGLDDGKTLKEGIVRVLEVGLEQWGVETSKAEKFTFADLMSLTGMHVSFSVTRIGDALTGSLPKQPQAEILSVDTSPDLPVADALVMSMTVPILYKPIHYLNGLYVDGGLLNNTPAACMEPDKTLIIRLNDTPFEVDGGLQSYLASVLYAPVNWIDKENIKDYPHCITVGSADVKSFSFKASREMLVSGVLDGMLCTFRAMIPMCYTGGEFCARDVTAQL